MKMKGKEQKGITLVALVITIVVLLILAGVALSSMQNGIIEKSKGAKEEYGKSSRNEENTLEYYAKYIDDKLNRNDEEVITNPWENAGLTEGIVVYEGVYYTNNDTALGWEEVKLQISGSGTLVFEYTYNGTTYRGNTTVNNCTVSGGNQIYVNTWEGGNISYPTTFYFQNSGTCVVDEECYIKY